MADEYIAMGRPYVSGGVVWFTNESRSGLLKRVEKIVKSRMSCRMIADQGNASDYHHYALYKSISIVLTHTFPTVCEFTFNLQWAFT